METSSLGSSSSGTPAHCVPRDGAVELDVALDPLDADPDLLTASTREICSVSQASAGSVELDCPEEGIAQLAYEGPEGLDLRQLPDEVILDFERTENLQGQVWLRVSLATMEGSVLVAFTNSESDTGFGVVKNPWIAPLWVGRRVLDCPPDDFGGSQCTLSRVEVNAPRGSVTAVQAEQVDVPGGWLMLLAVALECDTPQGAASPIKFGIIHESLLE